MAVAIAVGGVQVGVVLAVGRRLPLHAKSDDAVVILLGGRLPTTSPGRSAWRQWPEIQDRTRAGVVARDVAATDETQIGMIEVVGIELVDAVAIGARAHEAVEDPGIAPSSGVGPVNL